MTNSVILTGKIEEVFDMTDGVRLATLRCNDDLFYIYWEIANFQEVDVLKSYVCVHGTLQYIKYRKEGNINVLRILAIYVEEMEQYE